MWEVYPHTLRKQAVLFDFDREGREVNLVLDVIRSLFPGGLLPARNEQTIVVSID